MAGSMKATGSIAFCLLFVLCVAADPTNPLCETADDKVLCAQLTKGASNWTDAMTNVLGATKEKVQAGNKILDDVTKQLPASMNPVTKDSIIQLCKDSYDNIVYSINKCMEYVNNDPDSSLKPALSATSFKDCTDNMEESEVTSTEANQFGEEIKKLSGILLAMADKKPVA